MRDDAHAANQFVDRRRDQRVSDGKTTGKPGEAAKPVEIVFVVEGDHVKSAPVKCGISDDNYTEIIEGLHEGDVVVSGGYKRLTRIWRMAKKW